MILQMGWRNIWRNPRRTMVILTAVIIGVWSMIFLGGLMRGVAEQMVRNGIATMTGHLQIHQRGYRSDPVVQNRIRNPEFIYTVLDRHLPPEAIWTARVRLNAIANNARHSSGVKLIGMRPEKEARISFIGNALIQGRFLKADEPHGIIVGQALVDKFETRLGRKLVLMSQAADGEIASRAFRIVGIFRAEIEATEKQFVFVTLSAAQQMLAMQDDISEVAVLLQGHADADQAAAALKTAFKSENIEVATWKDLLPLVTAVLKMYDGFIIIWFVTVFIAMGFGLVNTILMAVFERIREFGLLRSLGMKPRLVVLEVLTESFFLLVIGTLIGNLLGIATTLALARTGIDLSAFAAGMEFVGMSRIIIPVIYIKDIVTANATVFVLGLLVSLYPAVKASRINPVQAMAHN